MWVLTKTTALWDASDVVSSVIVRNVSEEPAASILRVEQMGKFPTPKMKQEGFFEKLVMTQWTSYNHIPENSNLHER
jgi:hypothetical protein